MRNFSHQKCKVLLGHGMLISSPLCLANNSSMTREFIFTMKNNKSFSYQRKTLTMFIKSHSGRDTFYKKNQDGKERELRLRWKFHQPEPSCFWGLIVPACQIITFAAAYGSSGFWMSHSSWAEPSPVVLFPQIGHLTISFSVKIYTNLYQIDAH